jgi:hypothetical protein
MSSLSASSPPRAIVEVLWGPEGGRKAAIAPGDTLRVGRNDLADFSIPSDAQLSAVHFELAWDGASGRLRDLGGAKGVKVAGALVEEATITHGAWIRAGTTDFRVWVEGGLRPRQEAHPVHDGGFAPKPPEAVGVAEALLSVSRREPLHAVLDRARDDRIAELVSTSMEQAGSLYDGVKGQAMGDIAPYLVRFSPGSPLLERLVAEGWGRRWGIFLTSERPFKEVRRHLRRFLMVVDDETNERLYFRFYDPEVLRVFLPTCSARQAGEFWSDVGAFLFEDERGGLIRREREAALAAARGEPT